METVESTKDHPDDILTLIHTRLFRKNTNAGTDDVRQTLSQVVTDNSNVYSLSTGRMCTYRYDLQ